jgi:hypothetical protein
VRPCRRCPWPAAGQVQPLEGELDRGRGLLGGLLVSGTPSRPSSSASPGRCRAGRAAPRPGTSSPVSTVSPPAKCSCSRTGPARRSRARNVSRSPAQQVLEDLSSRPSSPRLELDLAPAGRDDARQVDDPGDRPGPRRHGGPADGGGGDGLGRGDREPGADPGALVDRGDSRTSRVNRATISTRCVGHRRPTSGCASCRSAAISSSSSSG